MKKTNKGTKKRTVALALALTLAFSNTTVYAADVTGFRDVLEENMPETTEDTAFEEITGTSETVVEVATDTEASTEAEMSEESTTEASIVENASTGPTQVLVGTSDSGIFREGDEILSEYNGVYLLNYETADQATEAVYIL